MMLINILILISGVSFLIYGISSFMKTIWNILDLLLIFLTILIFVFRWILEYLYVEIYDYRLPQYQNVDTSGGIYAVCESLNAICISLAIFNTLKYFQANDLMSKFWRVVVLISNYVISLFFLILVYHTAMALVLKSQYGVYLI